MSKTHVAFPYYMQDGDRLIYKGSMRLPVDLAKKLDREGLSWVYDPQPNMYAVSCDGVDAEGITYHRFDLRVTYHSFKGPYYLVFISPLHLKSFRDLVRHTHGTKPGRRRNRYPATGIFR